MENLKVKANNVSERDEIQSLFDNLGYNLVSNIACEKGYVVASLVSCGINFDYWAYVKEIALQDLRDLVVLKRNDVNDANYESENGDRKYYLTDTEFFKFINDTWVNIDEYVDGVCFKSINKEGEVKMKEYIVKVSGDWRLVDSHELVSGRIEVPEGAEIFLLYKSFGEDTLYFVKHDGDVFHEYYIDTTGVPNNAWIKGTIKVLHKDMGEVLWQRNTTTTINTSIQNKLKFIEKWLNGEKIQYILGNESEKTQSDKSKWHNFTEGAMRYIKRSDIKFREAPKYVTINGIEFKSVERLLKHVKNNFDLEGGE